MGRAIKAYNWNLELWHDSCAPNWKEILNSKLKLTYAASPIHQYDRNEDGTPKKAHRHLTILFEGQKTKKQAQLIANMIYQPWIQALEEYEDKIGRKLDVDEIDDFNQIEGVPQAPRPEPTSSLQASIQYFIHKNDKNKYQYDKKDIISHGVDIDQFFGWLKNDIDFAKREMQEYVIEQGLTEFDELVKVSMNNNLWNYILTDKNTAFFKAWMYNRAMIAKKASKELQKANEILKECADNEAAEIYQENEYIRDEKGI